MQSVTASTPQSVSGGALMERDTALTANGSGSGEAIASVVEGDEEKGDAIMSPTTLVGASSEKDVNDGDGASSLEAAAAVTPRYSVDLLQAFPEVCQKAKSGVQTCHVVAAFVQERANMETAYSKALLKVAQNAKADDWAPQLSQSWSVVQETLEKTATERAVFASKMQSSMVSAVKAFASQQELQVQRLIAEGTKVRNAQQQMVAALHKAKDKYDRKCTDAAEVTSNLRVKGDSFDNTSSATSAPSSSSPFSFESSSDDNARELAEKLTAGAGQLLTKMWDSTSSFGKSSIERQRSKVDSCLEDVISAEKHYIQTVDFMNAQRLIYEREIKENLHAFQLTEEQRIEYLKDLLLRQQKGFMKTYQHSINLLESLRESVYSINEIADIEDAFKKLMGMEGSDANEFDLTNNAFFKRMVHIQSLSDQGNHMVKVVSNTFADLIAAEDSAVQSFQKQLRIYENGPPSGSSDLFGASTSSQQTGSYLSDEGTSMKAGWQVARDQVQLLMNVHQEFRSLLSEPVALSLSTMKQQYENARNATQENFAKSHASLSSECYGHSKLQQKLEAKARDFIVVFSSVHDATGSIGFNQTTMSADQAAALLQQYSSSINDRRVESKLRHLSEEMREIQHRVAESEVNLKQRFNTYIQDVEVFVSVYMKNEKYRLQIKKSSMLAFVKAYEHMLTGALAVASRANAIMEKINPSSDVIEFVHCHQKPYQRSKRIVPAYHNNDILKDALSEYYRTKMSSPLSGASEERKMRRSPKATENPGSSPLKSKKRELALDLEVITGASGENQADNGPGSNSSVDRANGGETTSVTEPCEVENDVQPLAMSDFQKKFQLDSPEQVVESYSCALYLSNFPYHGRIYLTRDHICFTGWRDTTYVASYLDITHIEKKNTALIVPNAIELTVKGEKVFFASFVFRDECFQCLQQLQAIKKGTVALMTGKVVEEQSGDDDTIADLQPPPPPSTDGAMESSSGKTSPVSIASVVPKPVPQPSPTKAAEFVRECGAEVSSSAVEASPPPPVVVVSRRIPEKDQILNEYEVILDEVIPISVDFAFSTLWVESNAFLHQHMKNGGETNISISDWNKTPTTCTVLSTPETFDGSRRVFFIHNKKYMVGPSTIPTTQEQRYKLEPGVRLIVSSSSTVTDVPYCDYFRAENRWVFSATKEEGECRLQVGIRIYWIKSTWLKKQIEGAAVSEGKEMVKVWVAAALKAAKSQTSGLASSKAQLSIDAAPQNSESTSDETSATRKNVEITDVETTTPPPVSPRVAFSASGVDTHDPQIAAGPEPITPKFALQVASLCCVLLFIYTMLRICSTLEQMQMLTKETLYQQRQQQELFKEVMQAFLERERNGGSR